METEVRRQRIALSAVILACFVAAAGAASAEAIPPPCFPCDIDQEPGGGGGGGGGPQPVTVTGTFRYSDTNPAGAALMRPIAGVKVEVWRFAPHAGPVWTWAHDRSATTDANGRISVSFPFQEPGIIYALRITATNDAAVVWPNDAVHTVPFHQEPGQPDGAKIHRTANTAGATLDFSYDFTDGWTPQHFNLAEVLRHARAYAAARRHPGESEPIPAVGVQPTSVGGTWYNAPFDTVVITSSDVFNDHVVLHEYAHWLEEQIGSLPWSPTFHDGCTARDAFGAIVNSAGHAWMEGFADYFAQAVDAGVPGAEMVGDNTGTPNKGRLESPPACSRPSQFGPETVEQFVAGALWDLYDDPADAFANNEPADTVSRRHTPGGTAVDTLVFQIMDRELDMATSIGGPFPTILDFRRAWRDRGLSLTALDAILPLNRIPVASPAPPPPPPPPPDPGGGDGDEVPPVCAKKPYLPQCG